jgi:hypothetical protein
VGSKANPPYLLPLSVVEIGYGIGNAGAGLVVCGTGVLCFAGVVETAGGAVLILEGAGTAVSGAIGLGENLYLLSSKGRPQSNAAQNKQFEGAVKQLEKELGRTLNKNEIRELHEQLHNIENPGFWDIVEEGHKLFDKYGE